MMDMASGIKNGFFKSPFFIFLLGQVVLLVLWLGSFNIAWGKLSQQFVEIQDWRRYVDARIERMDKEGTNASRYGIQAEIKTIDQHEVRLRNVEEQTNKTGVIIEKISRIEEELKILNQNQSTKR
jgi:hypothetical protein